MSVNHPVQVVLPSALAAEAQALADTQNRPINDVMLEALEDYVEGQRWWRDAGQALTRARELGLSNGGPSALRDDEGARDAIARGLASARAGRLVDGDAVFARINAELDGLADGEGR